MIGSRLRVFLFFQAAVSPLWCEDPFRRHLLTVVQFTRRVFGLVSGFTARRPGDSSRAQVPV